MAQATTVNSWLVLINAETGEVKSSQKQMSGNATQYKGAPQLE
jgi:hypothetical protein